MKHIKVRNGFFSEFNNVIGNTVTITEMAKYVKAMVVDSRATIPAIARWLRSSPYAYVTNIHTGEDFIIRFRRSNGKIEVFVASKAF